MNSSPFSSAPLRLQINGKSCLIHEAGSRFPEELDSASFWPRIMTAALSGRNRSSRAGAAGRGAVCFFSGPELGLSFAVAVRQYRHGGLLRRLAGERFFSRRRFLRELEVHQRVLQLGIPVPQPLGVVAVSSGRRGWWGYFASRWLAESVSLAGFLGVAPAEARLRAMAVIGSRLRRLHDDGIYYADLQVLNILVGPGPDHEIYFIDFDKSTRSASPLTARRRRANLYRFFRSLEKFASRGGRWTPSERAALLQAYETDPRKYLELCRSLGRGLVWRRLFYRPGWWLNRS